MSAKAWQGDFPDCLREKMILPLFQEIERISGIKDKAKIWYYAATFEMRLYNSQPTKEEYLRKMAQKTLVLPFTAAAAMTNNVSTTTTVTEAQKRPHPTNNSFILTYLALQKELRSKYCDRIVFVYNSVSLLAGHPQAAENRRRGKAKQLLITLRQVLNILEENVAEICHEQRNLVELQHAEKYIQTRVLLMFDKLKSRQRIAQERRRRQSMVDLSLAGRNKKRKFDLMANLDHFIYNAVSYSEMDCRICLDPFMKGEKCCILPCGRHQFHSGCIEKWFEKKATCPLCVSDVSNALKKKRRVLTPINATSKLCVVST